jgi:hypothetical protein
VVKERPVVKTRGLFDVKRIAIIAISDLVYCLSHHTLVLNLSGPCLERASFRFSVLTDSSEVG